MNKIQANSYTIHDALTGYVAGEGNEAVRSRAAAAYDRFRHCGLEAARGLSVAGW